MGFVFSEERRDGWETLGTEKQARLIQAGFRSAKVRLRNTNLPDFLWESWSHLNGETVNIKCNGCSGILFFSLYCDAHQSEPDYWEKMEDRNLVLCIDCWLDVEMWVWHSKMNVRPGLKWTTWLDNPCVCQFVISLGDPVMTHNPPIREASVIMIVVIDNYIFVFMKMQFEWLVIVQEDLYNSIIFYIIRLR